MAEEYQIDDKDLAVEYATAIIRDNYPLLAGLEILYFRTEKGKQATKTKKANAQVKALTGAEVVITISDDKWNDLDTHQRQAQMHWALAHIAVEEKKDGSLKIAIKPPTVRDFPEVVAKWGSWQPEILEYVQACNDGGADLTAQAVARRNAAETDED